ncbi:hypothetical protein PDESU_03117 [Pontiella desulfatans]|uniref:PIN domain-containing protein n=1 Tax=Pontiella desulfatans TaxID=2750659 RepID=A0A6C2U4W7_PONDE|nr:PIN domain-containing protein [Pontiella desulfatans]VGO14554.1 hypothetical protein PDESU_03117 [Pontiella desulfatans]
MSVEVFVDTNVLVYSFDSTDPVKHAIAQRRLDELWVQNVAVALSIQVLQEFYVTMLRKGGERAFFREVVEHYMCREIVENSKGLLRRALDIHQEFGTSFYDANIIAAAQVVGAKELWSEDFNTGQDYGGVVAVNPFEGK